MGSAVSRLRRTKSGAVDAIAGNGVMDRRALLRRGVMFAGALSSAPLGSLTGAAAEPLTDAPLTEAPSSLEPGAIIEPYQRPSRLDRKSVV